MNFGIAEAPGHIGRWVVVVGMTGDIGDGYRVTVEGPDGSELGELATGELSEAITEETVSIRTSITFLNNTPIEHPGVYSIVLRDGSDNVVHRRRFGVNVVPREEDADDSDDSSEHPLATGDSTVG